MKKTYIQPSTLVINVAMQQMICESGPGVKISTSGSVDANKVESRSSSAWDDDDDY